MYPGALLFPAAHQTALMNVVCTSSLWFYRSPSECFRAQKIFTTYCSQTIVECKCVSDLLRKDKPKVLPPLPPRALTAMDRRDLKQSCGPWFWVPLSRVQSQVSARLTGGRTGEAVMGKILCY